jgi:hypothetical protein
LPSNNCKKSGSDQHGRAQDLAEIEESKDRNCQSDADSQAKSPSRAIDDTYGPSADLATRALTFPKVVSDFLKNAPREMIDDAFLEVSPFVHHGVLRSR